MRTLYFFLALAFLTLGIIIYSVADSHAGGPWSDQYCDVEVTQIRVVNEAGETIENKTEEKVLCNDGASDFLFDMGIADSCNMYTWQMPIGEELVTQRQIACHKMNGEYEIVQGYHSID